MDDKSAKDPKPIDWREHHATQPYSEKHSYEELAPAYVFLASNADSSYITGTVLQVMGGETTGG